MCIAQPGVFVAVTKHWEALWTMLVMSAGLGKIGTDAPFHGGPIVSVFKSGVLIPRMDDYRHHVVRET